MNTFQMLPEMSYFLAWRSWRFDLKERRPNYIDFQNSQRARSQLSSNSLIAGIVILALTLCHSPVLAKNSQPEVQRLMSVEDIAKRALASLVTVVLKNSRGQLIKSGSGFFVDPNHVVTNLHVISGGSSVNVVTLDKKQFSVSSARIDEKHDLAVLDCLFLPTARI
jgi:S1-C subfamily serine protease